MSCWNCRCPKCGSAAYMGLSKLECSNSACENYKPWRRDQDEQDPRGDQERNREHGKCQACSDEIGLPDDCQCQNCPDEADGFFPNHPHCPDPDDIV